MSPSAVLACSICLAVGRHPTKRNGGPSCSLPKWLEGRFSGAFFDIKFVSASLRDIGVGAPECRGPRVAILGYLPDQLGSRRAATPSAKCWPSCRREPP